MSLFNFQVIVIECGTNNHGHTVEQVVGGLEAILRLISEKQPQATVILLVGSEVVQ